MNKKIHFIEGAITIFYKNNKTYILQYCNDKWIKKYKADEMNPDRPHPMRLKNIICCNCGNYIDDIGKSLPCMYCGNKL